MDGVQKSKLGIQDASEISAATHILWTRHLRHKKSKVADVIASCSQRSVRCCCAAFT
jgi:ubiquitin C-terminal hydrolase